MIKRDGYSESLWQGTAEIYNPKNGVSRGLQFDVIIIGGGITGISTALELQTSGLQCLVLEAQTLCFGTTGGTTAHINTMLDTTYGDIRKNFGEDNALLVAQAAKQAVEKIKSNVLEYAIDCGFEETAAYMFSQDDKQTEELENIRLESMEVGVIVNPVAEIPVPIEFQKAIRAEGQAKFSPVKYVYALAAAFEQAGGQILQHCRVTGIKNESPNVVQTNSGDFTATNVIYATHVPTGINLLHLRCVPYRSYAMAVKINSSQHFKDLAYDLYDPYHYYRMQEENGINYLIVGGYDHKTGHEENTEGCFMKLEAHIRTYFKVEEVVNKWSSQYYEPTDGLPYIGHLPGANDTVFVATGFGGNGITYSHVAARVLTDIITKRDNPQIDLFRPGRIKPVAGFKTFMSHNAAVTGEWLSKLLPAEKIGELAELAPGEGRVLKFEGQTVALYKDPEGAVHAINSSCTHMQCSVGWNTAERSWDCPCHGARFNCDGQVLNAPASIDLEKINIEEAKNP